jgi:N utilization substance protein B
MRTLKDGSKVVVESLVGEGERVYALNSEGSVFLTQLLRIGENDDVRPTDLRLMIDRGWAQLVEPVVPAAPVTAPPELPDPPDNPVADSIAEADPAAREARSPLTRRTRGREVALQLLYLLEQNPGVDPREVERFLHRRLREPKLIAFTQAIVDGVLTHQKHLDSLISDVAENWRLDRMAAIDRNILRVGAYEMLYSTDVPTKVAINEALELAKRYSTAQSSRFVNGILDRLQSAEPESGTPAGEESAGADESAASPE